MRLRIHFQVFFLHFCCTHTATHDAHFYASEWYLLNKRLKKSTKNDVNGNYVIINIMANPPF